MSENSLMQTAGYMVYPRFLSELALNETAKLIYVLLFDRARLSVANGWVEQDGRVYIFYSLKNLAADSGRSTTTVKSALNALEKAELISRDKAVQGKSRKIYVKTRGDFLPGVGQKTDPLMVRKLTTNKNNRIKINNKYSCEEDESL